LDVIPTKFKAQELQIAKWMLIETIDEVQYGN
jgi:hypothetical protein